MNKLIVINLTQMLSLPLIYINIINMMIFITLIHIVTIKIYSLKVLGKKKEIRKGW